MAPTTRIRHAPIALAVLALGAQAQTESPAESALPTIVIKARSTPNPTELSGFGNVPLQRSPLQATVIDEEQMQTYGVARLADIVKFDASVSDSYNADGYWDFLSVRGYTLDNRFNYRRDGLPINAETRIPLDNKNGIEVLRGTSGIQAGTSAPGGLVNYVVKRPTSEPLRSVTLGLREDSSRLVAVDLGGRAGAENRFGYRINAAYEHLDPSTQGMVGHRYLLSAAGDWQLTASTLLEAEIESSEQRQKSVPGFSLLGNTVPAPVDPRINLNNQAWSLPNDFEGLTGSLRLQTALGTDWRWVVHYGQQDLHTDDHLAFPFGCSKEGNFDRYCSDGSFDLYDFRSESEPRDTKAIDTFVRGKLQTGAVGHTLTTGVLYSKVRNRFESFLNNGPVEGFVDGRPVPQPTGNVFVPNVDRDEHSTELYVQDLVRWTDRFETWLGLRNTHLSRSSIQTDGEAATDFSRSATTPWIAATYRVQPDLMTYASWGEGAESDVAPNLEMYTNRGQGLPLLKSRQFEVGIKGVANRYAWDLAYFDINRPLIADFGACDFSAASCTRQRDGNARHKGVEAGLQADLAPWSTRVSAMWLHARQEGRADASINGKRPVNVPDWALKWLNEFRIAPVPGLAVQADVIHEGDRMILPDNSLRIPSWTRFDAGISYRQVVASKTVLTWRAGVDNMFDKRAWKESPTQFAHIYLFPLSERTWRVSLQADL